MKLQYYFTHNNGSCDDIFIQHRSIDTLRQIRPNESNYKNRRRTFPIERSAVAGIHRQHYQQDRRHSLKIETMVSSPIIRRYSSNRRQQQQRYKKKRETLANIISNLSRSNSSTITGGNISSTQNDDTATRVDSDLDIKWESIRQYNPQLDSEKILEQDSEDEGYSYGVTSQEQRNNLVDMNESSNNSSSHDSNGLFLPAGQEGEEETGAGSNEALSIQMDAANSHQIAPNTTIAPKTGFPAATALMPLSNNVEHTDMFLFLFGFIFFPLWWVGTWRFFMQSDKSFLHKQQRGFQIVNCCMALASLLLTGLIIGLVTVWA
ncbi:unnamed protein product [Mucor circinelloides]